MAAEKLCKEVRLVFGMGPWELLLVLAIALVIFGPGKLPEVGRALGKGLREFRRASSQAREEADGGPAPEGR